MLNLVEPIFEKGIDQQSMDEARILLGRILDAFVGKFNTFKRTVPQVILVAFQVSMLFQLFSVVVYCLCIGFA
jgi:hypothetical protein